MTTTSSSTTCSNPAAVSATRFFSIRPESNSNGEYSIMLPHTLCRENLPHDIDTDLAGQLIDLQLRELTSLDYEVLLRLDDCVNPKTVPSTTLQEFTTEIIKEERKGLSCCICREDYKAGQVRKFLPCKHDFHAECIDKWLSQSSVICPLDGLSISQI